MLIVYYIYYQWKMTIGNISSVSSALASNLERY